MLLAFPGVDGVQPGRNLGVLYRLTEGKKGHPVVCAQFHDDFGSAVPNEVIRETPMPGPWAGTVFRIREICLELRRPEFPVIRDVVPHEGIVPQVWTLTRPRYQARVAVSGIGAHWGRR